MYLSNGECENCPAGQFGIKPTDSRISYCSNCSKNTYTDEVGQTDCKPCPSGAEAASSGANKCTLSKQNFVLLKLCS